MSKKMKKPEKQTLSDEELDGVAGGNEYALDRHGGRSPTIDGIPAEASSFLDVSGVETSTSELGMMNTSGSRAKSTVAFTLPKPKIRKR